MAEGASGAGRAAALATAVLLAAAAGACAATYICLALGRSAAATSEEEEDRLRGALSLLVHAQTQDLGLAPLPPPRPPLATSAAWSRVTSALDAVDAGYAKWAGKKHKKLLISSFDAWGGESAWKGEVDALLAAHAAKELPALAHALGRDPGLVLLLLEAPGCATTKALLRALPELQKQSHKICIPQADPHHYALMVNSRGSGVGEGEGAGRGKGQSLSCQAAMANRERERRAGGGGLADVAGDAEGAGAEGQAAAQEAGGGMATPPLLNVRQQRLDQWLSTNSGRGLRAAVFFADFETSWAGRPKVGLSPLRDVQRFLRGGFAADRCLLGLTLSFRAPHQRMYKGPVLAVADVEGFMEAEARAQGLACTALETVSYGMTFMLFLLERGGGEGTM